MKIFKIKMVSLIFLSILIYINQSYSQVSIDTDVIINHLTDSIVNLNYRIDIENDDTNFLYYAYFERGNTEVLSLNQDSTVFYIKYLSRSDIYINKPYYKDTLFINTNYIDSYINDNGGPLFPFRTIRIKPHSKLSIIISMEGLYFLKDEMKVLLGCYLFTLDGIDQINKNIYIEERLLKSNECIKDISIFTIKVKKSTRNKSINGYFLNQKGFQTFIRYN
jgi:hypothetical protein